MREMKKYLDLIPISAKKRKRQSRMTRLCIIQIGRASCRERV